LNINLENHVSLHYNPYRERAYHRPAQTFFGKKVEVTVNEVDSVGTIALPNDLKNKAFWEDIEYNPDFPSVEEIRKTAWPKREL
jgi:hypothetical protein